MDTSLVRPLGRPPVMLDVVEEHFEELDFLWEQRERVVLAPDWNLEELAELEERAEAHLDGLRLAELHAVEVARPQLAGDQTFAATAATFVLMEVGQAEGAAEVAAALQSASAPARDGIRIGLRHSRIAAIQTKLVELVVSGEVPVRATAADVLAFHRIDHPRLDALLVADDERTRVLAWTAHGRMGRAEQRGPVVRALADPSPAVRRAALEAAARSQLDDLHGICLKAARDANPAAVEFVGVLGNLSDADLLRALLRDDSLSHACVRALGALGDPATLPLLLELAKRDELLAACVRSVARITGVARLHELDGEADAEEARALLEVVTRGEARRLGAGQRWQSGRPVAAHALLSDLAWLSLESRRDVYLGLRAARAGVLDVELERRARPTAAS